MIIGKYLSVQQDHRPDIVSYFLQLPDSLGLTLNDLVVSYGVLELFEYRAIINNSKRYETKQEYVSETA